MVEMGKHYEDNENFEDDGQMMMAIHQCNPVASEVLAGCGYWTMMAVMKLVVILNEIRHPL